MELRFASYRQSEVLTANSAGAVVMFAADSINAANDVAVLMGSSRVPAPRNEQPLPFVDCGPIRSRFPTLGKLVFDIKENVCVGGYK